MMNESRLSFHMHASEIYKKSQEKYGLKVGDRVKVIGKAEDKVQGWGYPWVDDMNNLVGKEGLIIDFLPDVGYKVEFYLDDFNVDEMASRYYFPYFVLKKLK